MNTKGASAAGKSTLRPLQKKLAGDIGVDWGEFALISPDIWRKQLLDYGTLGAAYKYAGAFTGDELQIVDEKLDRYMARKAERGDMSHLLIDRFRFDSFAPHSDEAGSNLLTRFGDSVYLFFVITPPASLVERAWNRGLEVGRYKAVDDTLAHSVEAYSGMPELFFTWVARKDKRVQFEFLDNSVAQGERPRTVAFGSNDVLNVLDVAVHARRRALSGGSNVDARAPELLFADREAPRRRAQHRIPAPVRRPVSRGQFRRSGDRPHLPAPHVGRRRLGRREGARAGVCRSGRARRTAGGRAGACRSLAGRRPTARATSPTPRRPLPIHTLGQWGSSASDR